jgi:hypothetical protein
VSLAAAGRFVEVRAGRIVAEPMDRANDNRLTVTQAADLQGCSVKTVRRQIAKGLLPAGRIGVDASSSAAHLRVWESDVRALIDDSQIQSTLQPVEHETPTQPATKPRQATRALKPAKPAPVRASATAARGRLTRELIQERARALRAT